jgi:REP element-mobilizing transposase RayT
MSRPLRLEGPGALYHVTARGDRREPIVEDDAHQRAWVQVLGETCERFNWRVHAGCLMTNHDHVLVETPEGNLSAGMRHLNGVWSQLFNRRHGRVGHVFQGRFKAVMVEREGYLLELARYGVLNPVRAGMVNDAAGYRWSSHRAMLGRLGAGEPVPGWLETRVLLSLFAPVLEQARSEQGQVSLPIIRETACRPQTTTQADIWRTHAPSRSTHSLAVPLSRCSAVSTGLGVRSCLLPSRPSRPSCSRPCPRGG